MREEPKWIKTGVISTKSGKEIIVRWTPVYDELGIIDDQKPLAVSIYWMREATDKIIKALKEAMG